MLLFFPLDKMAPTQWAKFPHPGWICPELYAIENPKVHPYSVSHMGRSDVNMCMIGPWGKLLLVSVCQCKLGDRILNQSVRTHQTQFFGRNCTRLPYMNFNKYASFMTFSLIRVFTLSRGYLFIIQLQFFLLAWRALWPGWPLAFCFAVFRSCTNASLYVTEKYPLLLKVDQHKDGCYLKHISGVGRSPSLNCVCVVWTFMMHVLTFILQHLNIMTLSTKVSWSLL